MRETWWEPRPASFAVMDTRISSVQMGRILHCAEKNDVSNGGTCDLRISALNFWTHPWTKKALHAESTWVGSLYFKCTPMFAILVRAEMNEGFSLEDVLDCWAKLRAEAMFS